MNPFNWIGTTIINLPRWVAIPFGILFVLLGIAIFAYFYPKSRKNASTYKENQLKEWKKINPKRTLTKYKETKMFLPPWEKTKMMAPSFFLLLFCILGIAFIVGNTLTSL